MILLPLFSRLQNLSTFAGFVSLLVGMLVLIGWTVDSPWLKSVVPGFFVMKANTAVAFVLSGVALWAAASPPTTQTAQRCVIGAACGVMAIGLLTTLEYAIGWNPGFDQWLFQEPIDFVGPWPPGRIELNTAICFVLFGTALLLRNRSRARWSYICEGFTLGGLLLAFFLSLLGYLYHVHFFYGIGRFTLMALHTAVILIVVGTGILFLEPHRGVTATSPEAGGRMLRRLLPGILCILPALGWIRLTGERQGLYETEMGLAIFASLATVALFGLLVWTASSVNDASRIRDLAWRSRGESDQQFRRLAETIRESEERFEKAFRSSPHPMGITELKSGICLDANDACLALFGYRREEVVGTSTLDLNVWPNRDDRATFVQLLLAHRTIRNHEIALRTKHGELRQFLYSSELIELKGTTCIVTVGSDITERKRTEAALRESEGRYRTLIDTAGSVILVMSPDYAILEWNQAADELYGRSREQVLGRNYLTTFLPPEMREAVAADIKQVLEGTPTRGFENQVQTKTGTTKILLWNLTQVLDHHGQPIGIMAIGQDITERKETERTLRQAHDELESRVLQRTQELTDTNAALRQTERQVRHSEMFLSSVLEHLPNMVFVKDANDLRFVRINKTGEDLVGYPREALLGKSDYDFFPVAQADFFTAKDREVLQGGRLVDIPEEPIQTIDRGLRILHTKKIPLLDAAGNAHYLLGISEDITEHKQAEEALAERARLAEFSAEVSLTLNTECSIDERLRHCTEAIVRHMGAAFARIWTVEPGDLCDGCFKKDLCSDRTRCLHLRASAGLSTNLSGEYRRVPVGALKIGKIAQGRGVMSSNDILNDDRLPNKEWMREQGLQSFAGFPLTIEGGVYGVLALFAKTPLSEPTLKTLESTCNGVAAAIARQQAEEALRSAYGQLRDLARRLESAKEAERQKISRELHDEFGQALTGLKLDLAWLGTKVASLTLSPGGKTIVKKTEVMSAAVDALIDAVRETATSLRPSMLDDLGLIPALDWLVKQFRAKTTIDCRLETAPEIERVQMTADSSTALFRMTQEMLTNVIRHAHASTVHLCLFEASGSLILECTDDGDGIAVHRIGQPASLGLRGMEERAALLGGSFTITGIPGIGTTARVSLPFSSVIIPTMEQQP